MPRHHKEELSVITKLEAFYTGGNVQFNKDGTLMLCMCGEEVKIVNVQDGKVVRSVGTKDSGEELSSFLLSDNDEVLITAAKTGILKQWNFKENVLDRTWKSLHIGKVALMCFDNTTTLLATGGSDSSVKVWDIHRKYCTHNLKGAVGVFSVVKFQKFGGELCIIGAADDYKFHVWDLGTSKQIAVLEGHFSTVTGLVVIEEQNKMISCGRDKVVIVWCLTTCISTQKPLRILPVFEAIESVFLAPNELLTSVEPVPEDDICFVTAGNKGVLRVWKASTGKCLLTQENSLIALPEDSTFEDQVVTKAIFIPALNAVSVVTYEHNIILYHTENFELMKQFVGYNDDILDVKFMGKEDSFLAVATNSPHIKVFELSTYNCQLLKGHLDIVIALDVFPHDPYMLVSGSKDNSIRVWKMEPETNNVVSLFMGYGHTHSISSVACCRGKSKFFLSASEDTTLKLWNIPKKIPMVALRMTLSPTTTVKAHDKIINCVTVSSNDKLVATGSQDTTAKLWDATDLSLIGTIKGHRRGIWCVNFSPVDLVLATSSGDGTIKIWALSDFSALKTFEGHNSTVYRVCFLSRGTQLLSSSADGLLKLWDIKNTECIKTFEGHDNKVWALTVSADEELMVSGASDSNIIIWKDITDEEKEKNMLKMEETMMQEQDLSNLIHQKKWTKALELAVILEQPFRALNIINEILLESEPHSKLYGVITQMSQDQTDQLMKFAVDWNTNSKYYLPAQLVMKTVFKMQSVDELLKKTANRRATVESLLPYTERHYNRLNKRLQDAHILTFLCHNMKIAGVSGDEDTS